MGKNILFNIDDNLTVSTYIVDRQNEMLLLSNDGHINLSTQFNLKVKMMTDSGYALADDNKLYSLSRETGPNLLFDLADLEIKDMQVKFSTQDMTTRIFLLTTDSTLYQIIDGRLERVPGLADIKVRSITPSKQNKHVYFVLSEQGDVYAWGDTNKALGTGDDNEQVTEPRKVLDLNNVIQIADTIYYYAALTEQGDVRFHQYKYEHNQNNIAPHDKFKNIKFIATTADYVIAAAHDGRIYFNGYYTDQFTNDQYYYTSTSPIEIGQQQLVYLDTIDNCVFALNDKNEAFLLGDTRKRDYFSTQVGFSKIDTDSEINKKFVATLKQLADEKNLQNVKRECQSQFFKKLSIASDRPGLSDAAIVTYTPSSFQHK